MKATANAWDPVAPALVLLMTPGLAVVLKDEQVNGVMKAAKNAAFRARDW